MTDTLGAIVALLFMLLLLIVVLLLVVLLVLFVLRKVQELRYGKPKPPPWDDGLGLPADPRGLSDAQVQALADEAERGYCLAPYTSGGRERKCTRAPGHDGDHGYA